ncbi:hypothetical protein DFH27DRAFT_231113 [Peziza echinospora]|nr:hypothetical protein DFH27DRAFT_231113 [Peziza echinospora]
MDSREISIASPTSGLIDHFRRTATRTGGINKTSRWYSRIAYCLMIHISRYVSMAVSIASMCNTCVSGTNHNLITMCTTTVMTEVVVYYYSTYLSSRNTFKLFQEYYPKHRYPQLLIICNGDF